MQVCECMNDSSHVFKGRHLDGLSCPICGGPVLPKPYDKEKDKNLPYYRDLKKLSGKRFIQSQCLICEHIQRNESYDKAIDVFVCVKCNGASVDTWTKNIKYPSKPKSAITIDLNFDDKSKLKLRAIAKHVGALADELDRIDNTWSCDCGSIEYIDTELQAFSEPRCTVRECNQCHERYAIPVNDELPTGG